ncbi:hypothetical protein [Myxococcus fulvus]|uniref:hypothetical protein n=1 Tax=Myxococcus fulvus TaxID=33 RepID=UPI0020C09B82|nr:hypothetical protein [Myxococcus fulvus]MCK8504239.1 hypothetical protein [Myxococcus fulvus]
MKTLKTAVPLTTPAINAKAPALRTVGKVLCVGATSAALACTGTQVRPAPPSENCPPGAVEAMEKLDIGVGKIHPLKFPGTQRQVITVREGYTEWEVIGDWEGLPYPTRLSGRLVFGDGRVYGRLTEAHTPKGERIPVCMALYGTDLKLGLVRKPGGDADTAQVFSVGTVKAVERFE